MKENHDNTVWIVIGIIVALLLGGVMGACTGGMLGYGIGRRIEPRNAISVVLPEATRIPTPTAEPETAAVLVTRVIIASPADKAGIKIGDRIVALDGVKLTRENTMDTLLHKYSPGDTVVATVIRGSRQMDISIKLEADPRQPDRVWLGIYYRQQ